MISIKELKAKSKNPDTKYFFSGGLESNGSYFAGVTFASNEVYYPFTYRMRDDSIFFDDDHQFFSGGTKGVFSVENDTLHLYFVRPTTGQQPFDEKLIRVK